MSEDLLYENVTLLVPGHLGTLTDYSKYGRAPVSPYYGTPSANASIYKYYTASLTIASRYASNAFQTGAYFSANSSSATGWTFEMWFRTEFLINSGSSDLVHFRVGGAAETRTNCVELYAPGYSSPLRFALKNSSGVNTVIATPSEMVADTWYHLAVSFDGSLYRAFVDGALIGSLESSLSFSPNVWFGGSSSLSCDVRRTEDVCRYTTAFTPPDPFMGKLSNSAVGCPAVCGVDGQPAVRKLIYFPRRSPVTATALQTDSSGRFTSSVYLPKTQYDVVFLDDDAGEQLNDILLSRVVPV